MFNAKFIIVNTKFIIFNAITWRCRIRDIDNLFVCDKQNHHFQYKIHRV